MAKIIDISDWNIKKWIQTTGTRDKYFVEDPKDEKLYFFKESIEKFPSEFWSEIIASKVGRKLGFKTLDYNVGILNNTVGCICESMIDQSLEELEHGISLIKKAIPSFKVTERPNIFFSDVEKSFFPYSGFIYKFIDVLVFDAIVGNQDRHSENWAIIRSLDVENIKTNKNRLYRWLYNQYKYTGYELKNLPLKKYLLKTMQESALVNIQFSPIYDSGSSLGREISELNLSKYIDNDDEIKKYLKNGRSEIIWQESRLNHFELLSKIKTNYSIHLNDTIKTVLNEYKPEIINSIINEIDEELPKEFDKSRLSLDRKKLIGKFIEYRIKELKAV